MEDAKYVWNDTVSWRTKRLNTTKYPSMPMTINSKRKLKSAGELSKVCLKLFRNFCIWHIFGRHYILWSVNKLARSITKWTEAYDKRLSRLISYIYHTCEYKQYCYMGDTAKQCRLGLFQDSDFAGDLEDSKPIFYRKILRFFGKSYICSNELDVQETNFSFAQFNRIRIHFFGCRIDIRRYSRS